MKNFIVSIPQPCHEDWSNMKPDAKGKFCDSCSKSVFDFSNKTDTEIKDILLEYKDQKVCGHFKKSQVNRPLNISINLHDLPKNISTTRAFAIALFIVFGTFLFSCTDKHGQKVEKIEVVESSEDNNVMGDMSFIPPVESTMGEPEMPLDSILTMYYSQSSVSGAISYVEIPNEYSPVMDSVYLDEVTVVDYLEPLIYSDVMTGSMVITMGEVSVCSVQSDSIVEDDTNKTLNSIRELNIYPNPSNGEFTIKYLLKKRANVLLEIYDMKGILIKTVVDLSNQYEGNYQIPVSLNELPNGIYLVNIIKGDKKFVERVVIER